MLNQFKRLFESSIRNIGGLLGRKLRFWYYRTQFESCGSNIIIHEGVFFENPKTMVLGNNIWIDKNAILLGGAFNSKDRKFYQKGLVDIEWGDLIIGDNVHVAAHSLIQAHGGVKIGSNVTIASGSKIYSLSHHYKNLNDSTDSKRYSFSSMAPKEDQYLIVGNISIGDKAAVGLNSVVLPGSKIPNGAWLAVSSVVNGNDVIEENSVFSSSQKK
jgi:acetyltransferase-like isoleucine patch superfamily enzyme